MKSVYYVSYIPSIVPLFYNKKKYRTIAAQVNSNLLVCVCSFGSKESVWILWMGHTVYLRRSLALTPQAWAPMPAMHSLQWSAASCSWLISISVVTRARARELTSPGSRPRLWLLWRPMLLLLHVMVLPQREWTDMYEWYYEFFSIHVVFLQQQHEVKKGDLISMETQFNQRCWSKSLLHVVVGTHLNFWEFCIENTTWRVWLDRGEQSIPGFCDTLYRIVVVGCASYC